MRKRAKSPLAIVVLLAGLLFTSVWPISGHARESGAQTTAVPKALSPESISKLVSKMNPEQVKAFSGMVELLTDSINGTESTASSSTVRDAFKQWASGFGHALLADLKNVPELVVAIGTSIALIFDGKGLTGSSVFLLLIVAVLFVAWGVERLYDRAFVAKRDKIRQTEPRSLLETLELLSVRAVIEIGGVIVFAIVALLAAKLAFRDPTDLYVVSVLILKAILIYRLVVEVLRFVLAPVRTDLRLVHADDWTARYMYRNLSNIAGLAGVAFFISDLFARFEIPAIGVLRFWISLIICGWIIYATWKVRNGLTSIILGNETRLTPGLETMAAWWPSISIFVLALSWFLSQFIVSTGYESLTPARGALSMLLIILMPFLDTIVRGITSHLVPDLEGEGTVAEKAYHATRLSYIRIGRVILLSLMVVLIVELWGLDFRHLAEAGLGENIASRIVGFLFILAAGYSAWEITNLVVNKKLTADTESSGHDGGGGSGIGLTRMATILPILKMTIQATLVILVVLLALSQLGVNTTPLLAGAGVLGLAIGFGSQTLVKDIVSGVFFLLDDAFRAGEYIDVGGTSGTVEKISVRSMHLRGVRGPIHVLPYGSIKQLTNHSRDWAIMKLKFTIPFDTDIDMVRKLFKKIGEQMMEVPELADKFLEPFKGQGAADVTDVGIVVRGKFTTRPGDQWEIRKEIYNRVQKAFKENDIEFARKEVRVRIARDDRAHELTPVQEQAVAGAAAQAAETDRPPG